MYAEKDGTEYLELTWTEKFLSNESSHRHKYASDMSPKLLAASAIRL